MSPSPSEITGCFSFCVPCPLPPLGQIMPKLSFSFFFFLMMKIKCCEYLNQNWVLEKLQLSSFTISLNEPSELKNASRTASVYWAPIMCQALCKLICYDWLTYTSSYSEEDRIFPFLIWGNAERGSLLPKFAESMHLGCPLQVRISMFLFNSGIQQF